MADSTAYWWEKSFVAVDALASGARPLRERLRDAWDSSLMRMRLHASVCPELSERFNKIEASFSKLEALEEAQLKGLASAIVSLYTEICRVHLR